MPKKHKKYIDSDGVERGYYVYIHKSQDTGEVFYVGKGIGERAWETVDRNDLWKRKVTSLEDGWAVEIIKEDLSERDAFELEERLIEKYGDASHMGGTLTNLVPGGENPLSVKIGVTFDDRGWSKAYYAARTFRDLTREKQEAFAKELLDALYPIVDEIECIQDEAYEMNNERLDNDASNLDVIIGSVQDSASEFLRRRITWKDLGISLEEMIEDLQFIKEDYSDSEKRIKSIFDRALGIADKFLKSIDSGNKKEAQDIADRETEKS